jgi:hypothetical protein
MATIDLATNLNGGGHPSRHGPTNLPYVVEKTINIADAVTAKGSALAAADVIEAIDVPAGTVVLNAGVQVLTAGDASAATFDLGVTGVDADVFVDGLDVVGASAGAYAQNPAAYQPVVVGSNDTIDLLLATLTGTLAAGSLRVFAVLVDVSAKKAPGVATSTAAA